MYDELFQSLHRILHKPIVADAECKKAAYALVLAQCRRSTIVPTIAEFSQFGRAKLFEQVELSPLTPRTKFSIQKSLALAQRLRSHFSGFLIRKVFGNRFLGRYRFVRRGLRTGNAFHFAYPQFRSLPAARISTHTNEFSIQ